MSFVTLPFIKRGGGGVQTKNKKNLPPLQIFLKKYFNVKRVIFVQHLISLQQSNISFTPGTECCSNWIISLSNEFYVSLHFMLRCCLKCLYVLILLTIKLTYSFFANMYRDRIFLIYTCFTFIDWLPSLFYLFRRCREASLLRSLQELAVVDSQSLTNQ